MIVAVIVGTLILLMVAVAIPGMLAMWTYPRRFGWKTRGFDTPGYLWKQQDERARRSRERRSHE